ncbi:MAG: hypothetical protein ACP5PA_06465, partial [Elusimicrobiales bacterium]
NRNVAVSIEDQITDIEISHIEGVISHDIEKLEKKIPDTITVLTTLIGDYAVRLYVKDRQLKQLRETVDKKIDELIEKAKDIDRSSSYL